MCTFQGEDMSLDELKRRFPILLPAIHSLLSAASSLKSWPFDVLPGFQTESVIIAVVSAAVGTILGLRKQKKKYEVPLLLLSVLGLISALKKYSSILAQVGATTTELWLALALFGCIFLIIFYVLTYLERTLTETFT